MTIHRFFVPPEQITPSEVRILGDDAAQIRRVLRLEAGSRIEVFDGSGRQVDAQITGIEASAVTARPLETTFPRTEVPCPVHLLQALLKGEKMDWVVEKATELGAASIILFPARRSVVQLREERSERKTARWGRIAKEAAEQCGRVRIPEVKLERSLRDALKAGTGGWLFVADEEMAAPLTPASGHSSPFEGEGKQEKSAEAAGNPGSPETAVFVLVGPEGGWTAEERETAREHGAQPISLGPRILRAETAAVVALSRFTLA